MATVRIIANHIQGFINGATFEHWLAENHARSDEIWLRIEKKGSPHPSVSYAEALDVALCWGWIDGLKKGYDEHSFLQRFTPRKPKSMWSRNNIEHVERLVAAGRMTEHGQKLVDAARADGRWEAAYAGSASMEVPADLRSAIAADPRAEAMFVQLNRQNRFALAFRVGNVKTAATRAKKIAGFVEMLSRGETPYPNGGGTKGKAGA